MNIRDKARKSLILMSASLLIVGNEAGWASDTNEEYSFTLKSIIFLNVKKKRKEVYYSKVYIVCTFCVQILRAIYLVHVQC